MHSGSNRQPLAHNCVLCLLYYVRKLEVDSGVISVKVSSISFMVLTNWASCHVFVAGHLLLRSETLLSSWLPLYWHGILHKSQWWKLRYPVCSRSCDTYHCYIAFDFTAFIEFLKQKYEHGITSVCSVSSSIT